MTTDPDMTAAELALGLLDGAERAAALRRVLADPDFAREVEEWRERLAGLFDDYPEVAAPDVETVVARLDRPAAPSRSGWRAAAVAASVAAVLAIWLVARPQPQQAPQPQIVAAPHRLMVASLTLSDKSRSLPALVDVTSGEIRTADSPSVADGKSAELWLIGADGVPKAVGLLAETGPSQWHYPLARRAELAQGATLAISIEPAGGSPTGKPTGPVVASGVLLET
ncbi:MAG: anti-sigma factor [Sphingomonas sp.]